MYPVKGPYSHLQTANTALADAMASDLQFANSMRQFNISIPRTPKGTIKGGKIPNFVWHHATEPGIMQLVLKHNIPKEVFFGILCIQVTRMECLGGVVDIENK